MRIFELVVDVPRRSNYPLYRLEVCQDSFCQEYRSCQRDDSRGPALHDTEAAMSSDTGEP